MTPDADPLPETMRAVVTVGTGGYEQLRYRDVPVPRPGRNEVLLKVLAAGVNATDVNTRIGWYDAQDADDAEADADTEATGWNGATSFPLIQGADCCGRIVATGPGADTDRIGERVLVRSCMRATDFDAMDTVWLGTDMDGAFAEYVVVPASEAFRVDSDWSDVELASLPCSYGTAENMVGRAGIHEGRRVLVPGASGGVGSAVVQLAKRRGAEVVAVTSAGKRDFVRAAGADTVLDRDDDLADVLGEESVDVVIDNVAGPGFPEMLQLLRRGGRYVTSGAIAGPLVELDLRTMYLKDLRLVGCTAWDEPVFPNLVSYVERGEIRPLVDRTFALPEIADAQRYFQARGRVGKIVLLPAR